MLTALLAVPVLLGAGQGGEEPPKPRPDGAQRVASRVLFAPVRWVDQLFGETIGEQEVNRSYLRISGGARWKEGEEWERRPSTRLKLDFPRTHRRLSLLVSGRPDDDMEDLASRPDEGTELGVPADPDQNNSFAGLNHELVNWVRTRIDLRAGMRAGWHPFGQLRYRQDVPVLGRWLLRLQQTGEWIHDDGVGSTTRLELDRPIRRSLFRFTTRAKIQEFDGLGWSTGVSLYTPLTRRLTSSLDLSMLGVSEPRSEIVQYRLGTRLRVAVRPRWWFFEVDPEIAWPLAVGRHPTPALSARTEIVIGWVR